MAIPNEKPRVARRDNLKDHPLVRLIHSHGDKEAVSEEITEDGRQVLGVAAPLDTLGWTVIVEQPRSEAFQVADQLQRQLILVVILALLFTVGVGYFWGRSFVRPIFELMRGTKAVGEGHLDERVKIDSKDEFRQLGDSFNSMADKLVELTEDVRKKERQAMFGRMAAGLVHDLSHPVQNIGNSCKLIVRVFDDPEYRQTFTRTIDREIDTLKRVLDDLRNVARPAPVERFPMDVNRSVADIVESMRGFAEESGIGLEAKFASEPVIIEGDAFALGRVYRNLITNAIQATQAGGRVTVTTARDRRQGGGERSPTPARASRRNGWRPSSTTSSPPRSAGWDWASLSPNALSSSSTARSPVTSERRQRHHVHDPLSGGAATCRRRCRSGLGPRGGTHVIEQARQDRRTSGWRAGVFSEVFRKRDGAGDAALQLRAAARAGRSHHSGRQLGDRSGIESGAAGARDNLQPDAGRTADLSAVSRRPRRSGPAEAGRAPA